MPCFENLVVNMVMIMIMIMIMNKNIICTCWCTYVPLGVAAMEAKSSLFLSSSEANFFSAVDETLLYRSTCKYSSGAVRAGERIIEYKHYYLVKL